MREYGSVSPQFWIGKTGKQLRGNAESQVLALYLMTSPHANMIGVFHCPVMYMAHETGLGLEGASKALASLVEAGFCLYDDESETVFVIRMAAHQVGENLKADDNKVKGVQKEVAKITVASLKKAFVDEYAVSFHLIVEAPSKPLQSGQTPPSKQLTGTGQEQNQNQEQNQDRKGNRASRSSPPECPDDVDGQVWSDWCSLRKSKKAPITATVINEARQEAIKAGLTFERFLTIWCARGSQGLQADWLKPQERASHGVDKPPTSAELRLFNSSPAIMDPVVRARCEAYVGRTKPQVIEVEVSHANAISMD